ncbi:MAG: UDP-N-acetylmuramate dehydrogenase, partial [Minisyncoccales bacterium]
EKVLPQVKKNILLKNHTTFKIGGRAKYFFEAKRKEDLIRATFLAKKLKLPYFILGGGSNVLVSDKGFEGIVIKVENKNLSVLNSEIYAEAGVKLAKIVNVAAENSLSGFEFLVGIPGTVGGAIFGNCGAFGKSIGDLIKEVEIFDLKSNCLKVLKKRDCAFSYRDSIFKKNKNLIILSAIFKLKRKKKDEILKKMKENLKEKIKSQPLNFPSAGCIFKNPGKISAGKLIEMANLKGKKIGGAKISEKHANFILNFKKAKAKDVRRLIRFIKQKVKKKFGIVLEEEICHFGF